jgi:hypothetical protein
MALRRLAASAVTARRSRRRRGLVSGALLGSLALLVFAGIELGAARGAAGDTIHLILWPAGQGKIVLDQAGRAQQTCDFVDVVVSTSESTCAFEVTSGTPVTLTATPEPGKPIVPADRQTDVPDFRPTTPSTFVRWSRFDCGGTGSCTFTPDTDNEWITAVFTPLELEVGINGSAPATNPIQVQQANGSLQPLACDDVGFNGADHACHGLFAADADIVLVASPSTPVLPIHWGPGCEPDSSDPAKCTVTMSNIRTFAAVAYGDPAAVAPPDFPFKITPTLTVHVSGSGHGRVTGTGGVDCRAVCSVTLDYQARVSLKADADQGSSFIRWRGVCSTSPTCVFAAGSASSVGAVFDEAPAPTTPTPTTTTTTTTTSVTTTTTTTTATTRIDARLAGVATTGHGVGRAVVVTVLVNRSIRATIRLVAHGKARAARTFALAKGRNVVRLAVPRTLRPGLYTVAVQVGTGSTAAKLVRSVKVTA